jgi:hypothetical protein
MELCGFGTWKPPANRNESEKKRAGNAGALFQLVSFIFVKVA